MTGLAPLVGDLAKVPTTLCNPSKMEGEAVSNMVFLLPPDSEP